MSRWMQRLALNCILPHVPPVLVAMRLGPCLWQLWLRADVL